MMPYNKPLDPTPGSNVALRGRARSGAAQRKRYGD